MGSLTVLCRVWHSRAMPTTTPRQRDIDERLRHVADVTLAEWIDRQRAAGLSWWAMSIELHQLTGDTIPDETLRRWGNGQPKGER